MLFRHFYMTFAPWLAVSPNPETGLVIVFNMLNLVPLMLLSTLSTYLSTLSHNCDSSS